MDQKKIGKFILQLRKEKNMTQQKLADKIGVTDRAISKWENGRGMPDISLINPLCQELGITVNELLSGERLNSEEYQNKFEENIISTLDYSNKKINRIKFIFISITMLIVIAILTLSIFFAVDVTRMRNNKPVFFSTWGFEYVPPINIDDVNIENAIKEYLIRQDERNNYYENEKSFVAMRTFLIEEKSKEKYFVYAFILQEKYYEANGEIINDTASAIPHRFELSKKGDTFTVEGYVIPRDGDYYAGDMKHIFPVSVLRDIDDVYTDGTIERLSIEVKNMVNLYFHK